MCILLGAIFEISFYDSINTAFEIVKNPNITFAVHTSQLGTGGLQGELDTGGRIKEFMTLNHTCLWTSTNEDKCFSDADECFCIKSLAEKASTGAGFGIKFQTYEEIVKFGLLRDGKFLIMKSYLTQHELRWGDQYNQGMGWHRSDMMVFGTNPYRGYLTNKKWIYNEDITIFIFRSLIDLHPSHKKHF